MRKHCAIVLGGIFSPLDGIDTADFVIACDKGYAYIREYDLEPDLVVGDFDSYHGKITPGIEILDLPTMKDDTDTLAAIRYALEHDYKDLTLYCAFGGRFDHLMGNVQAAMYAVSQGAVVRMVSHDTDSYLFSHGDITLEPRMDYSLSVLALFDECHNVTITGAKYALKNATLYNTKPVGVSNVWHDTVHVKVGDGILMVSMSHM